MLHFQMANLADLESNREMLHMVPLYETGLLELKHGSVPCRTLRYVTKAVKALITFKLGHVTVYSMT